MTPSTPLVDAWARARQFQSNCKTGQARSECITALSPTHASCDIVVQNGMTAPWLYLCPAACQVQSENLLQRPACNRLDLRSAQRMLSGGGSHTRALVSRALSQSLAQSVSLEAHTPLSFSHTLIGQSKRQRLISTHDLAWFQVPDDVRCRLELRGERSRDQNLRSGGTNGEQPRSHLKGEAERRGRRRPFRTRKYIGLENDEASGPSVVLLPEAVLTSPPLASAAGLRQRIERSAPQMLTHFRRAQTP